MTISYSKIGGQVKGISLGREVIICGKLGAFVELVMSSYKKRTKTVRDLVENMSEL